MWNHAEYSGTVVQLDPSIWQHLSPIFMASILVRVPLHSVARFRAVCRYWNVVLRSPDFFQAREVVQTKHCKLDGPFILTFSALDGNRGGSGYLCDASRSRGAWKPAGLNKVIRWFERSWLNQGMIADGGLICYNNLVLNILTGSNKWLQCPLPSNQLKLCGFKVERSTGNFRAFYLAKEDLFKTNYDLLFLYDSKTGLWWRTESPRPLSNWNPGVVFNNCIYFVLHPRMDDRALTMMCYNTTTNSWGSVDVIAHRSLLYYERFLHQWRNTFYVISTSELTNFFHVDEIIFMSFGRNVLKAQTILHKSDLEGLVGIRNSDLRVCNVCTSENLINVCLTYTNKATRHLCMQLVFYDLRSRMWGARDAIQMRWNDCMVKRMMVAFEPNLNVAVA